MFTPLNLFELISFFSLFLQVSEWPSVGSPLCKALGYESMEKWKVTLVLVRFMFLMAENKVYAPLWFRGTYCYDPYVRR